MGINNNEDTFTGTVGYDFYLEGGDSEALFSNGNFVAYYINNTLEYSGSGSGSARTQGVQKQPESCKDYLHVAKCVGKKYEDQGTIERLACSYSFIPCLGIMAADCLLDGCDNVSPYSH